MFKILKFITLILLFASCDLFKNPKEDDEPSGSNLTNTLNQNLSGNSGNLDEFFYDFDSDGVWDDVDVKFNRWEYLTINQPILYDSIADTLNFRTFFDHLLTLTPEDEDSGYTERELDTLFEDVTYQDSVTIQSHQFKNVEKMVWDLEPISDLQRYKPTMSGFIYTDTTLYYDEVFDSLIYRAVIDTPFIDSGYLFVDDDEWVDTTYTYVSSQDQYDAVFYFSRKQLGLDSLMYRNNRDCNDNGVLDDAESVDVGQESCQAAGGFWVEVDSLCDTGNGVWDDGEIFYDHYPNGEFDSGVEPFEDRNCNGYRDEAEPRVEVESECEGIGIYMTDDDGGFCDTGNGEWDDAEYYTDLNNDQEPDSNELFNLSTVPSTLLVDYSDPDNPQPVLTINPGDDITMKFGSEYVEYENIIEEIVYIDSSYKMVDNIDSTVTLFTHQIVEFVDQNSPCGDYYITKTQWEETDVTGDVLRNYDYHIYKKNGHVNKLEHPSYFLPPGFHGYYFGGVPLDEGFWFENDIKDKVIFYGAAGGTLRDGEIVEIDTLYETVVGDYHITRNYQVVSESVEVPLREPWEDADGNGVWNDGEAFTDLNSNGVWDVPTEFSANDCFKITDEVSMTLIGPGVTYYERVSTWLVRGIGIVKETFEYHWNEDFDNNAEFKENARIELSEFRPVDNDGGLLRTWNVNQNHVNLDKFDEIPDFDFDPFIKARTTGLQRVAKEHE